MDFEFVIPVARDDLLNKTGVSHYVVDEVLSFRDLAGSLQGVKSAFRSKGAQCIIDNFDVFFSILCLQKDVKQDLKEDAWAHIVNIGLSLSNQLTSVLEEELDPSTKKTNLNMVKMTTYLLCQYMEMLEADETKPQAVMKGKGKSKKKSSMTLDWQRERESGMKALLNLVQLNIHRLWDPPVVEEEFVGLVTNCCYKMLENPEVNHVVNKDLKDAICHILGVMVKRYNHGLGASLKIIQLLQHFEHLVSPLASVVHTCLSEYGNRSIVADLMREIGQMDSGDLARDTSGTRSYSAFLVEMSEKEPSGVLPNISLVLSHLDGESYSMRNGVLGAMGEIVIKVLSKDDLDDKQKVTRDQFLEKLEDHIHDIHALVRSKVLQIWLNIVQGKCLPLPHQENLLKLVIGRLHDKSSSVRKYSITLITALLKNNPFAAKLSVQVLEQSYMTEVEKLKELMPEEQAPPTGEEFKKKIEEEWKEISKQLRLVLKEVEEESENRESPSDLISEEETIDTVKDKIYGKLVGGALKEASVLMQAAIEVFPDLQQIRRDPEEEEDEEADTELPPPTLLDSLQTLFQEKKLAGHVISTAEEPDTDSQKDPNLVSEINKQQVLVQYLKESLAFATQLQNAVPVISQLLGSKNLTDVMEAIEFFVTGFEFGLTSTMIGIRRMLPLIWSKESGIKDAVVNAYKRLYLNPQSGNARDFPYLVTPKVQGTKRGWAEMHPTYLSRHVRRIFLGPYFDATMDFPYLVTPKVQGTKRGWAEMHPTYLSRHVRRIFLGPYFDATMTDAQTITKNLSALLHGATLCDITSLEGLIRELVKSGELGQTVYQMLWEKFTMKISGTTEEESRAAVQLISMAAGADMGLVKSNIDVLVKEGFGPRADTDLLLARDTCLAVLKLGVPKAQKGAVGSEPYRLSENHEMFTSLTRILVKSVGDLENRHWVPLMEQAVNVMYKLGEMPDTLCANLIKRIALECGDKPEAQDGEAEKEGEEEQEKDPMETEDEVFPSSQKKSDARFASGVLARLLSLVGHVALRQLIHLDVSVFGEMKRRRAIQEQKDWIQTPASKQKQNKGMESENMEEEMGLAGAAAEDAESEYILKICECEVVTGSTLLGAFGPLVVAVCTQRSKYPDVELQTAASLTLAKFMTVSSQFCEQHLQLLFTILEKSQNPVIRANTIIALGDLCFRFPNLIEPWTPHLYARLRDESPKVRKNTMQVLTHLILNDMLKVKGHISEMGICIVDEDERISSLAKLFFMELAKKGNAVYNIMPDMISRLSDPDVGIDEENFRIIMKYMFSFIQKDKHCESLVEKLCHRYRATRADRQWRDLSYCLSMLSYSEKCLAKLHENFLCFADKLAEEEVYNCFCIIINKSRSFAKPEAKTLIDELEQRLEACHKKGLNEDDIVERAGASPVVKSKGKTPHKSKTPAARKAKPRRGRRAMDSSDEEDGGGGGPVEKTPAPRTQRVRGAKKKPAVSFTDSDDSDIELFQVDKTSKKKKGVAEKENETEESDSEPLTPVNKPTRKGKHKRRLNSLNSPLSLNNTPL